MDRYREGNLICGHVCARSSVVVRGAGATVEADGVRLGDRVVTFAELAALPSGYTEFAEPELGWPWIVAKSTELNSTK